MKGGQKGSCSGGYLYPPHHHQLTKTGSSRFLLQSIHRETKRELAASGRPWLVRPPTSTGADGDRVSVVTKQQPPRLSRLRATQGVSA